MAKTTWRFEFVDINKSITINEVEATWTGYAVIRAPKGQTKAMYIPPHNPDMINAMFGYASADWPDLFELQDFNNEYGVYVSAPTVDVADYPNYYGGVYFTKQGIQRLYGVTNKKAPNYEVAMLVGSESSTLPGVSSSKITLTALNTPYTLAQDVAKEGQRNQACFRIEGVDPAVFKRLKYIDIRWKRKGNFRYTIDKINHMLKPDNSCVIEEEGQSICCGSYEMTTDGSYTFIIGGEISDQAAAVRQNLSPLNGMNTKAHEDKYGIPFLDFAGRTYKANTDYDYSLYMRDNKSVEEWQENDNTLYTEFLNAIAAGGKVTVTSPDGKTKTLTYDRPITEMVRLIYDIKDDVYAYLIQPSPTANKTEITIDSVTYDKYKYEKSFLYTTGDLPTVLGNAAQFEKTLCDDGNICIKVNKSGPIPTLSVWEYKYSDGSDEEDDINSEDDSDEAEVKANAEPGKWVDVTDAYETVSILAFDAVDGRVDADVHHKIYMVSEGALVQMTTDATEEDFVLKENTWFNSFHAIAKETDLQGEIHTSGDFIGSLDEFGVDENNRDIYWQELLPPDDSVCYAEVYVVKTFDDDLDENGIYTGTRISSKSTTVYGQRYVDFVVGENINAGYTGGNCTDTTLKQQKRFTKIVKEGLIEAAKPKYGDCSLFMEFTGLDTLKTYFAAIRTMHNTSTIISPKNISEQLFANVNKIKVVARLRGSAQYCQELQYKDKNVRKKYYACPIGAVGVMLMRIMEDYLGGKAPAWLNEGSVGGQLEEVMLRAPIAARWDFEDIDTKIMDQKGLNPILLDNEDGAMIVSHRTTEQDAGDWSYLGHSMSFDLCKREIRDNVMKPQLMKRISPYYIEKRQNQVNRILAKRTTGDDPIWSYASSDVAGANNEYTKAQRIFNIPVEVRVYPYSERVRLSFTNLNQISTMSD